MLQERWLSFSHLKKSLFRTLVVFTVTRVICLVDPFGIAPLLTQTLARILITILTILAVPTNLYSIFEYATQGKPAAKSWITKWRDLQDLASVGTVLWWRIYLLANSTLRDWYGRETYVLHSTNGAALKNAEFCNFAHFLHKKRSDANCKYPFHKKPIQITLYSIFVKVAYGVWYAKYRTYHQIYRFASESCLVV